MRVTDFYSQSRAGACPIHIVVADELDAVLGRVSELQRNWVLSIGWEAKPGTVAALPGADGRIEAVLAGSGGSEPFWARAALPAQLPAGTYMLADTTDAADCAQTAVAWGIGQYAFSCRSQNTPTLPRRLVWPESVNAEAVLSEVGADAWVRDLVNTPAGGMGPDELSQAAAALATDTGAGFREVIGDALLTEGFPAIHAVGQASTRLPRLLDVCWGDPGAPRVTLVGKGVCFDTGGLNLKPAQGMRYMKKDMGGAAHALGLARMIIDASLPVRLRVLIPAVENSVAGNAYRPGDVVQTRAGLTVEVGNTDAEGRLVLADALALADEEAPDFLLDFATLTGAARVALGPDMPALFSNDDTLTWDWVRVGMAQGDPIWPLPLWTPYAANLTGGIADLNNVAGDSLAGAIYGGLFLQRFVKRALTWAHVDTFAWNPRSRPGRPEGGMSQGVRGAFALLGARYPRLKANR